MGKLLKTLIALASVAAVGAVGAAPVSGQGTWETTLQARDLTGDGVADAFYDTTLDITWLATVSVTPYDWADANAFAQQDRYGLAGWRLPTMIGSSETTASNSGTDLGFNVRTKSGNLAMFELGQTVYSEIAHLFYVTLGNKAGLDTAGNEQAGYGLTNSGNFQDLSTQSMALMWTDREYAPNTGSAWEFNIRNGSQETNGKGGLGWVFVVRDGDVSDVPEPATLALVAVALLGAVATRRRKQATATC